MKGISTKDRLLHVWVPMPAGIAFLTVLAWCVQASIGPMDCVGYIGDDGQLRCPDTRNLFQHLHWLWGGLLVVPGICIGAMRARNSLRCIIAYGVALPLGWIIAAAHFLLAYPVEPAILWRQLGMTVLSGIVWGALSVGAGTLGRWIVRWAKRKAGNRATA